VLARGDGVANAMRAIKMIALEMTQLANPKMDLRSFLMYHPVAVDSSRIPIAYLIRFTYE
jgi:hypothetical protein